MKKQLLIISFLLFLSQMLFAGGIDTGELVKGKWMNKSDGFIPNPLGESDHTVERYKLFTFNEDQTFLMDSAKIRYTGKWHVDGESIVITYDKKAVVHYSKNIDPNNRSSNYETTDDVVELGVRIGTIKDGKLSLDDGKIYTHNSSSVAGLKNFWEFTGFANATSGHLVMLLIGLFFIFLAIRFHYEPLLLIPIGVGILIGNIPMFQAVDFNLGLGVYEPGSVMNILYGGLSLIHI